MIVKMVFKEIKGSLGRFLAILAIVALGVGFFTGLRLSKTAMIKTLDEYTDELNMYDWRLISTLGFDDDDEEAFRGLDWVEDAEAGFYTDLLCDIGERAGIAVRCYAMPERINTLFLKEGRLPEAANECVVDGWATDPDIIGKSFTVSDANSEDSLETVAAREFTVVGIVNSPLYINYERGNTSIGSGSLDSFAYMPKSAFSNDYYTDIYLTVKGADGGVYTEEYEQQVESCEDELEAFLSERADVRFHKFYDEAADKLEDADREYADGKAKYEDGVRELDDALGELTSGEDDYASGRQELDDGYVQYEDGKKAYEDGLKEYNDGKAKFDAAKAQYEAGLAKYNAGKAEYEAGLAKYESGKAQIEAGEQELDSALAALGFSRESFSASAVDEFVTSSRAQLEEGIRTARGYAQRLYMAGMKEDALDLDRQADDLARQLKALEGVSGASLAASMDELEAGKAELETAQAELEAAKAELEAGEKELASGKAELDRNEKLLADAKRELDEAEAKLRDTEAQLADGEKELSDARQQLDDGWKEYDDGTAELEDAKKTLDDASKELEDAKRKLADFEPADTFTMTRRGNVGYVCFESDSDIVKAVSRVFPVFFFAVAALICITTMTRMVNEQRTQIGVLKALGYSRGTIMAKYLIYTAIASVVGAVIGSALGSITLPRMIWQAYNIMYGFASLSYAFDWPLAIISSGAFVLCTLLATFYACLKELSSVPADLIRPAAPKAGKRIFLERIPFLWSKMPFLHKVSARNVLRYRQRMLMMILGIGGCTALLLTGFGINDSIQDVTKYQFEEVTLLDCELTFSGNMSPTAQADFSDIFSEDIEGIRYLSSEEMDVGSGEAIKGATVVSVCGNSTEGFFQLHMDGETVPYPTDGVVINDGLADKLGVDVGDRVFLQDADSRTYEFTVEGIFENHVYNYAFLSADAYTKVLGHEPEIGSAWVRFKDGADIKAEAARMMGREEILNVNVISDMVERVDTMMDSLKYITVVIIVCAGALAFIVLYNLANINITERIREIATIKVLGFYRGEVSSYVFRENFVLTLAGAIVGIPMGLALHRFVMAQIKIDLMKFAVRVLPVSYLWSIALTVVFFFAVNFAMRSRLNRIDMAQALKSVE